ERITWISQSTTVLDTQRVPQDQDIDLLSSKNNFRVEFERSLIIDENSAFLENILSKIKNIINIDGVSVTGDKMKIRQVLETKNNQSETAMMILQQKYNSRFPFLAGIYYYFDIGNTKENQRLAFDYFQLSAKQN